MPTLFPAFMLVLVHHASVTLWSCPGVLYVVPVEQKQIKSWDFFPPGYPLFVVVSFSFFFQGQTYLSLKIFHFFLHSLMSLQSCPRNFIFTFMSLFIDAMIVIPYTETMIVILSLVKIKNGQKCTAELNRLITIAAAWLVMLQVIVSK